LVSPLDIEGTAHAMAWALDMPAEEREARLAQLRARIDAWPAAQWLAAQLAALNLHPLASKTRVEASAVPPAQHLEAA